MISYAEFLARPRFDKGELLAFSEGELICDPPVGLTGRLPAPPMLLVDRIDPLEREGTRGRIVAEYEVNPEDWFFLCHFRGDPVQPGCLCADAIWQLLGFFCLWRGAVGSGRALGCREIEFEGEIRPWNRLVRYEVTVRRFVRTASSGTTIAIGTGRVFADGKQVCTVRDAKTGVFTGIAREAAPDPGEPTSMTGSEPQ